MTHMAGSMSPCTIEKDVLDAMKKFRRLSNKATMAMLCKLMKKTRILQNRR
jgi:hypothetical protein